MSVNNSHILNDTNKSKCLFYFSFILPINVNVHLTMQIWSHIYDRNVKNKHTSYTNLNDLSCTRNKSRLI